MKYPWTYALKDNNILVDYIIIKNSFYYFCKFFAYISNEFLNDMRLTACPVIIAINIHLYRTKRLLKEKQIFQKKIFRKQLRKKNSANFWTWQ